MTALRSDQMIYGYEQCDNCKWRHIYFHEPVGMETVYLRRTGFGLECTQCNELSGRLMALAEPVEYSVLFGDEEDTHVETESTQESTIEAQQEIRFAMGPVQHMRALIRWISPWTQDGKDFLAAYSIMIGTLSIICLVFGGQMMFIATAVLCTYIVVIYLAFRMIVTLSFVMPLLFASRRGAAKDDLQSQWREFANPRLFNRSRDRRADLRGSRSYLRKEGRFSRKDARKIARKYVNARRHC